MRAICALWRDIRQCYRANPKPARGYHANWVARQSACGGGTQCGGLRAVGFIGQVGGSTDMGLGGPAQTCARANRLYPVIRYARGHARSHARRPILKIKLGTPDDMPRLEAVRQGAPKSTLIIDANEGWTPDIYTELAPHLIRLGVALVEQPLPAGADEMLGEIARPLPVCADESAHDAASLAPLRGKYDMVNLKLDKTGGLTEALIARKTASDLGLKVMVGCMVGSSLAMAPAVILAQGADYCDLDGPLLLREDRDNPLFYDAVGVHPPPQNLWG